MNTVNNKKCVVIGKPLVISWCPINSCVFKNVKTNQCTYSGEDRPTVAELAESTGRPCPDEATQQKIKTDLLETVQKEIR